MAMEKVVMSRRDLVAFEVLNEVLRGERERDDAASLLRVCERTIRRKAERVGTLGWSGLLHGNAGKQPKNRRSDSERETISKLLKEKYSNFNVTHAREKLRKDDGIVVSYGSLRELMMKQGPLKKAKRRRKTMRQHRDRMPKFGVLLQMDGSPHRWNGKDEWCLIAAIDDATSYIPYAEFFDGETTLNCMKVLQKIIERCGIPQLLYVDRAGLFGGHKRQNFSQFKRACKNLGIKIIFANSPQAKGRIERAWGTMQDRLVAELQLAGINQKSEANDYLDKIFLPEYWNKELTVQPEQSGSGFRRLPEAFDLDEELSIQFTRNVANNSTVSIDGDRYRIVPAKGERLPVCLRTVIMIRQDATMSAKIRGETFPLEKIAMPRKEPMRCVEPCAKNTASKAPGEGTRLREGPPQARAKAVLARAPKAQGDAKPSAGGECSNPSPGVIFQGVPTSVLNPRKIRPKRRLDKVA
jgi:hypothetical protein